MADTAPRRRPAPHTVPSTSPGATRDAGTRHRVALVTVATVLAAAACATGGARFNTDNFDRRWEARARQLRQDSAFADFDLDQITQRWEGYARHLEDSLLIAFVDIMGRGYTGADSATCAAMLDPAAPPWANVDSATAEAWVGFIEALARRSNEPRPTRPVLPSEPTDSLTKVLIRRMGDRNPRYRFRRPGRECEMMGALLRETVMLPTPLAAAYMRAEMARALDVQPTPAPAAAPPAPDTVAAFVPARLDVSPQRIWCPTPAYPPSLLQTGIEGSVVLEFVIGTNGRVEPHSIRVVRSPHPGFEPSTIEMVAACLFQPGFVRGSPVRALVEMAVEHSIERRGALPWPGP